MKLIATLISLLMPAAAGAGWNFFWSDNIKTDEQVILFPAEAWQQDPHDDWIIRIHGWVFEPETFGEINALLRKAIGIPDDDDAEDRSLLEQRLGWFTVDNERGKRPRIRLGNSVYKMNKSAANGHFTTDIRLAQTVMQSLPGAMAGAQKPTLQVVLPDTDRREFNGTVQVMTATGLSIISDIDDTIKLSNVTDKKELIRNTFMRPFQAAPGMAGLYRQWQQQGAAFHYVSASPWQLYPSLASFMQEQAFPPGLFYMKYFRWKDNSFLNLFADPVEYKLTILEPIVQRYPQRRFILVGDSGEKDPEVYGMLARKYPQQIERILIRRVGDDNNTPRFNAAFTGLESALWQVFSDTAEISTLPVSAP